MRLLAIVLLFFMGWGFTSCDEDSDPSFPSLEEYLERNNITDTDYEKTATGLIYVIEKEGTGDLPKTGQTVLVHYTGYHLDDSKFDSSYDRNEAFAFLLGGGRVIAGWDEGLRFFRPGGAGTLYIPYELAYGTRGRGTIAPKEDLKFDINLISID